jgi:hypothetical protein
LTFGEEFQRNDNHNQAPKEIMKLTYLAMIGITLLTGQSLHSQEAKEDQPPKWQVENENKLSGTWLNLNPATRSIPKVEIFREGAILKIRVWGRTHPQDTPHGPPDALFVLSDVSEQENRPSKPLPAVAFATHKADFAIYHFTLRLSEGKLTIEKVTLFLDDSKRSNRIEVHTFKKDIANAEQGGRGDGDKPPK